MSIAQLTKELILVQNKQRELNEQESEIITKIANVCNNNPNRVEAVKDFIVALGLPQEFYDSIGCDHGQYYHIGNITIKSVPQYGYTDIIGLSDQEFEELEKKLQANKS